jgi:hypothetical protein
LDGQAEALTQKANTMASGGDVVALRLCIEERSAFSLPPITSARDAVMAAVTKAVATGHVTPGEATEIAKVIDAYVRAYQTAELDDRVARIEQMTDAELMRVIMNAQAAEAAPAQPTQRLLVLASLSKNRLPHLGEFTSAFHKIVVTLIANDDAAVRVKSPGPIRYNFKKKAALTFNEARRALIRAGLLFRKLFFWGMFS